MHEMTTERKGRFTQFLMKGRTIEEMSELADIMLEERRCAFYNIIEFALSNNLLTLSDNMTAEQILDKYNRSMTK